MSKYNRRAYLRKVAAGSTILSLSSSGLVSAQEEKEGFVKAIRSNSDPVTSDHMRENRAAALQKFKDKGGEEIDAVHASIPGGEANVIAHVVMYDAEKGIREFIGTGVSNKDDSMIREDATEFIRDIRGTQTISQKPSRSSSANTESMSTTSDEYWDTVADSVWSRSTDPYGKYEVPYKWRKVRNDGSTSYEVFGYKSQVRMIPGVVAYDSNYHNSRAKFTHESVDSGFRYIEDYGPSGMNFAGSSETVNLGWNTAYWSWTHYTEAASIEQNGDTTTGKLVWDVPNNNGDKISGDARNSTLRYEPGSSWRFDQPDCENTDLISNYVSCTFNQDGSFVDSTDEVWGAMRFSYDYGSCNIQ